MSGPLRVLERPASGSIPEDPLVFLETLEGPTAWYVPGRDPTRLRIVTTLLHGNETSGFLALHDWLRSNIEPAVDAICLIANVEAARIHPVFTNRSVPERRDLNRCFHGPFDDPEGALAGAILELISRRRPEAVVDLHNNTGHNPPYAIGIEPTADCLALTGFFARRFIWSHLTLGALLEAVPGCPAITVEVGKTGEDAADRTARAGVAKLLETDSLFDSDARACEVQVLKMPMRARMRRNRRLVMAQQIDAEADLTIPDDLDRHNFETVPAGSRIGWVHGDGCPLELVDEHDEDRAEDYFERRGDALLARRPFMPIMITVDAAIAASDCLFYVVHDISSSNTVRPAKHAAIITRPLDGSGRREEPSG